MNVHRDETTLAPVMLFRERKQPLFDESGRDAMRALAPHLNRALRVTLRLKSSRRALQRSAETNDRALAAIVLTDPFGGVAEANSLARAILAEGRWPRHSGWRAARRS